MTDQKTIKIIDGVDGLAVFGPGVFTVDQLSQFMKENPGKTIFLAGNTRVIGLGNPLYFTVSDGKQMKRKSRGSSEPFWAASWRKSMEKSQ